MVNLKLTYVNYSKNQTKEKARFLQLLNLLVDSANIQEKPYVFGRPSLQTSDILKCCAIKVYTNLSCRRVIPELEHLFESGLINQIPSYNMLNHYMRQKWFGNIIKELIESSALPFTETDIHFAIDATGFSDNRYSKWFDVRYQRNTKLKQFLKLHLVCSTDSMIVPAVEVTRGKDSESPYFKKLINKTSKSFQVLEVYADKGYSSRENHEVVRRIGGKAYIPFKSNAKGVARGSYEWTRAFEFWKNNPEEFNKTYHRRSLNESVFSSIKRTKLNFVRSKNFTASKNEILLKVLCHNLVILANQR